jgi:phospholipid/cholesterol/gamma-HCH transport system ATP-binding protein
MIQTETNIKKYTTADYSAPAIDIKGLYKSFGKNTDILKGVNLTVKKGENLVVLGKSGSGKSVLIKCLVGLVTADRGELKVFDTDITKLNNRQLNEIRVRVGFLFQNSALYDSMSVRENLSFPLKRHSKKSTNKEVDDAILSVLESVGLTGAIDKMPSELSGGMRKRIGLARTLILQPEIVLYDEPTTGLDTMIWLVQK